MIALLAAAALAAPSPPAPPALSADLRCLMAIGAFIGLPATDPHYDAALREGSKAGSIYFAGRIAGQTDGMSAERLGALLGTEMSKITPDSLVATVRACGDRMKREGDALGNAVSAMRTPG